MIQSSSRIFKKNYARFVYPAANFRTTLNYEFIDAQSSSPKILSYYTPSNVLVGNAAEYEVPSVSWEIRYAKITFEAICNIVAINSVVANRENLLSTGLYQWGVVSAGPTSFFSINGLPTFPIFQDKRAEIISGSPVNELSISSPSVIISNMPYYGATFSAAAGPVHGVNLSIYAIIEINGID